jgi:hypothetical protein
MGFLEQVDAVLNTPWVRLVVVIVLILIVLSYFFGVRERFLGGGVQDKVFTSGATMRVLSQGLSATNQQDRQTISNMEIKEMIPGIIQGSGGGERLVGDRADPNFFEIGDELAAYQSTAFNTPDTTSAGDTSTANTSGTERLSNSPAATVEDIMLAQQLGTYPSSAGAY